MDPQSRPHESEHPPKVSKDVSKEQEQTKILLRGLPNTKNDAPQNQDAAKEDVVPPIKEDPLQGAKRERSPPGKSEQQRVAEPDVKRARSEASTGMSNFVCLYPEDPLGGDLEGYLLDSGESEDEGDVDEEYDGDLDGGDEDDEDSENDLDEISEIYESAFRNHSKSRFGTGATVDGEGDFDDTEDNDETKDDTSSDEEFLTTHGFCSPPSITDDLEAAQLYHSAVKKDKKAKKRKKSARYTPFTKEETNRLITMVGIYGTRWAKIIKVDAAGDRVFVPKNRNQREIREKARNIAEVCRRNGKAVPKGFEKVGRRAVEKAGDSGGTLVGVG